MSKARKAPCESVGTVHSDDRVTVERGHAHPFTLCGYHAQPVFLVGLKVRDDVHPDCTTCHRAPLVEDKVRTYYGHNIYRETRHNSMGLRWWAIVNGRNLRADTLAGMRELIRHYR